MDAESAYVKHLNDFGRIAVIGETTLEEWGTKLSAPFAAAEMRTFGPGQGSEALEWLGMERSAQG